MQNKLLCLIAVFIFCSGLAFSQDKFTVLIDITYKNDMVKNEMYSYLAREVRALKDVEVVSASRPGTYTVSIVMVDAVVGERKFGYAVSATITRQMHCTTLFKNPDGTPQINKYDDIESTYLYMTDELKNTAQSIIAQLDAETLETWRKVFAITRPKKP